MKTLKLVLIMSLIAAACSTNMTCYGRPNGDATADIHCSLNLASGITCGVKCYWEASLTLKSKYWIDSPGCCTLASYTAERYMRIGCLRYGGCISTGLGRMEFTGGNPTKILCEPAECH